MIELDAELARECEQIVEKNDVYVGLFAPDIEKILWKRGKEGGEEGEMEFLIKFKNISYLHAEWLTEEAILNTKTGKNKLNRFNRGFAAKRRLHIHQEGPDAEPIFFDPSYV